MKDKRITLADIFLEILSKTEHEGTRLMAERIKAAIKSPEISELVNVCVTNATGHKYRINIDTVNDAIDGIISFVHSEIDNSILSDDEKEREKASYTPYAKSLGELLKNCLRSTKQLIE